jgi:predicted  nucleic acid-binding Zn-ribbon protein
MKVIERLQELQELEMGPNAETPEAKRLIEQIRKETPEMILGHYDRLRARGKKGVATVVRGVCTGCRMRLATGSHATLIRNDDVSMCDSCGRYLLLAPMDPAEAAPVAEKPAPKRRGRKPKSELVAG